MFTPEFVASAQKGLSSIESSLISKNHWVKNWTTVLSSDLPSGEGETRFHIQRIGCEPPTIEVSLFYFLSLYSAKPSERTRRIAQFNLHFTDAIRHAQDMARSAVFVSPTQARELRGDSERAKRAELRETRGVLPDRFFSIKWIAVVSELATPESSQVAIIQSPDFPTTYDMVREGKRQLTEKILAEDSLAETIQIIEEVHVDPEPSSVVISAHNGAIHTTVSYEALGGNVVPIEA